MQNDLKQFKKIQRITKRRCTMGRIMIIGLAVSFLLLILSIVSVSASSTIDALFIDSGQNPGGSNSAGFFGDLDGDGDLDAFFSTNGPNEVWLNDGKGTFSDSGQRLGDSAESYVALADVDGDGDLDAFVTGASNTVWLNDGTGTFSDSGQRLGDHYISVALGDVDSDGDLDAFVGSFDFYAQPSEVWLNNGSGIFSDSGQRFGYNNVKVDLGDVDGDGDLDALVVVLSYSGPSGSEVWLNDGKGTFSYSQGIGYYWSFDADLGDVDGDGDLDAFLANGWIAEAEPNVVWLNDGKGTFNDSGQRVGNSHSESVALGDVDGDGDLDAFVANGAPDHREPNMVWLNDGTGTFSDSGENLGDSISYHVALGDVDGDRDLDALVTNDGDPNKLYLNMTPHRWTTAYNSLIDPTSNQLEIMRTYRDNVLSKTARGRKYKKKLYKHSEKALVVLLENPELVAQAKDLIYTNILAVDDVIHGQEGIIYNTDEIEAFLDAYAKKAPFRLKLLAKMVKWQMLKKQRKGKLFFGFRLK
jgi:hypothetical protein